MSDYECDNDSHAIGCQCPGVTTAEACEAVSSQSFVQCQLPKRHGKLHQCGNIFWDDKTHNVDMVNHPPHYTRGPKVWVHKDSQGRPVGEKIVHCIEVIRHITDMRLATAMKYIWRVAFGGKENDREDIEKAIWYLKDWLENPIA